VIEEVKGGHFFAGGNDPLSRVVPVIVLFYVPEGVIGETDRVDAVRLIQAAVAAGNPKPTRVLS
jgi:hypothetical protein